METKPSPSYFKQKIPLRKAFFWLVFITILVSGGTYGSLHFFMRFQQKKSLDPRYRVIAIVQTGPQKEALNTVYLAELLGISTDRPTSTYHFNTKEAERRLLSSPIIKQAEVKVHDNQTLYVDYSIRQPIAWLYDIENAAIDEEGYIFPMHPFFTPKKLPEIYLGLSFQIEDNFQNSVFSRPYWKSCLKSKNLTIALNVLKMLNGSMYRDFFHLKRIDVSNAEAESYGTREIVLITEDEIIQKYHEKEVSVILPRILRLSTKGYQQELGNYLKLRPNLLKQEAKEIKIPSKEIASLRLPEKTIDFRIPHLAFIEENK
jgi:hypothetical protein